MEREDLDIMSEFMVMAATLLDIKCRMLLPKEVNEEGEEEDPRAELVQQLLEYKMYKYMSYELRDRMNEASRSVYKEPTLPREVLEYRTPVDTSELLSQISLAKLHTIYKMILKRQEDKIDPIRSKFGKIEKEEVSLPDKMTYVEQFAVKKAPLQLPRPFGIPAGQGACDCHLPCNPGADENRQNPDQPGGAFRGYPD